MSDVEAEIALGGDTTIELNVLEGTLGQDVTDIHSLSSKGVFTFNPGFTSTTSRESKITFIDGDEGVLLRRSSPIDQLTIESNYLEVYYALLYGKKPAQAEYDGFRATITRHTMIHEQITRLFHAFHHDSHPIAVICGIIGALAASYHDSLDVNNPYHRRITVYHLLSKIPTITAMYYKYSIGQPFVCPHSDLFYAGNFLRMMFTTPCEEYEVNPVLEHTMDRILVLHADRKQNALTSMVHTADFSGANPFACIAAGIAFLWGPAHGGANETALEMLGEISFVGRIPEFVRHAKDKSDSFRLMGFGHRVYKDYDPRATIIRETYREVLKELGIKDGLLQVAMELEYTALNDPYFIEKKPYPNVDFYPGIILKAMGIPSSMFTAILAMARTVGWIAHWDEMCSDGMKIARPRQLYTGYTKRDYQPDIER